MNITADSVKQLRERTGAGMMECKKALVETGGDLDAAAELMRKTGLAKADKKATRIAAEGTVAIERDGANAAAGRGQLRDRFRRAQRRIPAVRARRRARRARRQPGRHGCAAGAAAGCRRGRRGAAPRADREDRREHQRAALHAHNGAGRARRATCMVRASVRLVRAQRGRRGAGAGPGDARGRGQPAYVDAAGGAADVLDKERSILAEQTRGENKPAEIIAKMVEEGRLRKFLAEITLVATVGQGPRHHGLRSC